MDLKNPKGLNEKIQWLKLHYRDPLQIQCADKAAARDYVKKTIGADLLVPMLGVYQDANKIPFGELPDSFIIKSTHASGWNLLCTSKQELDVSAAREQIARWISSSFFPVGREWVYKHIPRAVIVEELIADGQGRPPDDYKIFTFHGEPKFIQVCRKQTNGERRDLYTPDWERIPCEYGFPNIESRVPRPENLSELLDLAGKLAKPFPFVRVDLYNVDERIYFGELTFFPAKGAVKSRPRSFERQFGDYIDLERVPPEFVQEP